MKRVLPPLLAILIFFTAALPVIAASYVVQPGDTLYSIATRYGTTVDALMAANGLTSNVIWIGQTLQVGSSSTPSPTGTYHTVVHGDTLYSIARRYGTTVEAIMQANHLTSPNIYVGQRLIISPSPVPPAGGTTYTVVQGDTLYSIARRYGTTVEAIMAANHLSSTLIYVGQRLLITSTNTPLPPTTTLPTATLPTTTAVATATPNGTPAPTAAATLTPSPTSSTIPPTQTPTTSVVPTVATPTNTPSPTPTPTPTLVPVAGFGDGTYAVGTSIQPGTYRSNGIDICYWARLSGFSGDINDVIANGNHSPEIVTVSSGDAGFETNGCGHWVLAETTAPNSPATQFGDGTYMVGVHIAPGTYQANGSDVCYWARLSDFSHEISGIIANGNNPTIITIDPGDAGFTTFGCGTWSN